MQKKIVLQGRTRSVLMTALLSAVSVVFMYLEFSVPFLIPEFIKMDFSDLPGLIASFSMGPMYGLQVVVIKNLLHLPVTMTGGIGELSNAILSGIFVVTAGVVYRHWRTRTGALVGSTVGALAMAAVSVLTNYFVIYPIYYRMMPAEVVLGAYQAILPFVGSILQSLVIFNMPFTFLKGMLDTLLAFLLYKHISPFIKGKAANM